jgi:TetR/AcrR family tetracycline transcriptional repressor
VTALGSFIIGDTLETQTSANRVPDAPPPSERFDEQYPTAMAAASTMGTDNDRFEEGLSLFLDGLRARLEARDSSAVHSAP